MSKLVISATLCLALTGAVLSAGDKPADKSKKKQESSSTRPAAINKICPVDGNNAVVPSVTTVIYNDQVIGFCCEDCVPKFREKPDWYMRDLK